MSKAWTEQQAAKLRDLDEMRADGRIDAAVWEVQRRQVLDEKEAMSVPVRIALAILILFAAFTVFRLIGMMQ